MITKNDYIDVVRDEMANINVLSNDQYETVSLPELIDTSTTGIVLKSEDSTNITYQTSADTDTRDQFIYALTDQDNNIKYAQVYITIKESLSTEEMIETEAVDDSNKTNSANDDTTNIKVSLLVAR